MGVEPVCPRIMIVECKQEISSFNPVPSRYEDFRIEVGDEMLAQDGLNTALGGALPVLLVVMTMLPRVL